MAFENFKKFLKKERIFDKDNLNKIDVFGSLTKRKNGNDISVEDMEYQRLTAIKKDLKDNYNLNLNIVLEKYANPIVLMRTKKEIAYVTRYN